MFRVCIYKEFGIFQTRAFLVLDGMGSLFDIASIVHKLNKRSCDCSHCYTLSNLFRCSAATFKVGVAICDPLRWVGEVMEHFAFPACFDPHRLCTFLHCGHTISSTEPSLP